MPRLNGIWVYRSWNFLVDKCRTVYNTYGIFITYGGFGVVSNSTGDNAWHAFENTFGGKHMQFSNCIGSNCHFVFRFHPQCYDVVINDFQALGSEGIKFGGRKLVVNGGIIRGNPNSTGRLNPTGSWGADLAAFYITNESTDATFITINNVEIEGKYSGTSAYHRALVRITGPKNNRHIIWNNCKFRFLDSHGYYTMGSALEEFNNCTFEQINQTTTKKLFDIDHYSTSGFDPVINFNNSTFINVPNEGVNLKFSQHSITSYITFNGVKFSGRGTTSTTPIVMRGSNNGYVKLIDNIVNVSSLDYWIDAGTYHPDMLFLDNIVLKNMNNDYRIDMGTGQTITMLSGNRTHSSDDFLNPAKLSVVDVQNTTMVEILNSAPTSPQTGTIYVNSSTNIAYIYINNSWKQITN